MAQNRTDLVAALGAAGFTDVNDKTPLSEIAQYMKWSGTLLDIRIACYSKATKAQYFFSENEWSGLSSSGRSAYEIIGLCIRAEGTQFIIAKNDVNVDGTTGFTWGQFGQDVPGLANRSGDPAIFTYMDCDAATDTLIADTANSGRAHDAASAARAYKTDGKADDPTKWSLMTAGQGYIVLHYTSEINAAMKRIFGDGHGLVTNTPYWTSAPINQDQAWVVSMGSGNVGAYYKTGTCRVRPVASVISPAI